jgi:hypothetical protein
LQTVCNGLPIADNAEKSSDLINIKILKQNSSSFRQDEGDGAELGLQVGQIINGVVTGNIGDIFEGTVPFIEDEDTAAGVGTILTSLTNPLNTLWSTGTKQGLMYFGITLEPTSTTVNPLLKANATTVAGQVTKVAVTVPTTEVAGSEDEDDGDGDNKI